MRAVLGPLALILGASALAGCGLLGRSEPPTIAGLPTGEPPPTEPTPVEAARLRAIGAYDRYLRETPEDDPLRIEAMRRLADLRLMEREARELEGEDPQAVEAVGDYVPLYEALLRRHPDDPRADQVRYQLARAYEAQGRRAEALAVLADLVARDPDSPLAAEAQFRRAEMLFTDKDYAGAAQAYDDLVRRGAATPFLAHARYKLGWTHYKLGDYPRALEVFTAVLDSELPGGAEGLEALPRGMRERAEDSLRAMSLSFIAEGGPAALARFYSESGSGAREYEDVVIERLATTYLAKEQFTDAAETYRLLAEHHPLHPRAPEFDHRAIEALAQGGFRGPVLEAKAEFARRYRLDGPYWVAYDPTTRPEVTARLKQNLTDLARHYHARAQAGKKPADYQQAEGWYRAFVASFPGDPETPGMDFLLAELLFESGRYADAVSVYERTAYRYPRHRKGAEAGYAALLAYPKALEAGQVGGAGAWRRRAVESALLFEAVYSGHPKAAPVLTQAAQSLYDQGEAARARSAAETLLARYPEADPALRRKAWTVAGHAAFDLGDYAAAERAYAALLSSPTGGLTAEQRGRLSERLAASIYRQGEAARAVGDLRLAAEHFLRVGRQVPQAQIRPTAEYDAAAALLQLEAWGEAARVLEGFCRSYPAHPLRAEVDRKLAAAYLRDGQGLRAAGMYEVIAREAADPQLRREALGQAAELYRGAGRLTEEARVLAAYVQAFPRPLEPAVEARHRLAELSREAGDMRTYHLWLTALVEAERAGGAERSDRTRYLAGHAVIALAEPKREAYRSVRLVAPIKENLRAKKQRMEQAIEAYGRAVDYGLAEVVTAATCHIADLYYDFSRALLDSERPKELNADELEQYEILLEEQAFPFEEKAIAVHELNVRRIPQGVYDEWVRKSLEQLARLLPVRYAKPERNVALVQLDP